MSNIDLEYPLMIDFVLLKEGGYVNDIDDKGGETNKGITHTTYDFYRKSKGLPTRNVRFITDEEVHDIYYNEYYKASGADKIDDPRLAMFVFDTAINHGLSTAKLLLKRSGGNLDKFIEVRMA